MFLFRQFFIPMWLNGCHLLNSNTWDVLLLLCQFLYNGAICHILKPLKKPFLSWSRHVRFHNKWFFVSKCIQVFCHWYIEIVWGLLHTHANAILYEDHPTMQNLHFLFFSGNLLFHLQKISLIKIVLFLLFFNIIFS